MREMRIFLRFSPRDRQGCDMHSGKSGGEVKLGGLGASRLNGGIRALDMSKEETNQSEAPLSQEQAKPMVHVFWNKLKLVMAGAVGALTLAFGGLTFYYQYVRETYSLTGHVLWLQLERHMIAQDVGAYRAQGDFAVFNSGSSEILLRRVGISLETCLDRSHKSKECTSIRSLYLYPEADASEASPSITIPSKGSFSKELKFVQPAIFEDKENLLGPDRETTVNMVVWVVTPFGGKQECRIGKFSVDRVASSTGDTGDHVTFDTSPSESKGNCEFK
jgi:hypothetical protein